MSSAPSTLQSSYSVRASSHSPFLLILKPCYPEERPGHHVKLYQYCSGDVSDIVQRHIRVSHLLSPISIDRPLPPKYDGEHDTRTPHDFANNANNIKADDTADVDDDDADDDEHDSRHTIKRGSTLKLKQEHINGKNSIPPPDPDLASVDVRVLTVLLAPIPLIS